MKLINKQLTAVTLVAGLCLLLLLPTGSGFVMELVECLSMID